jgi:photosynthetic reaction center H subunit
MSAPMIPAANHPGAANLPVGNPMLAGVGPGAWADRPDVPDRTVQGEAKIRPLRTAPGFSLESRDPNPIGMTVIGADGVQAGICREAWVNTSEPQLMYLELELAATARRVLVPVGFVQIDSRRRTLRVNAILAAQFADVPATRHPDLVTLLEEDKISAYYAGGYLYATPNRSEPIV